MKYWTCPLCGANLDHNEKCNCREEAERKNEIYKKCVKVDASKQLRLDFKELQNAGKNNN